MNDVLTVQWNLGNSCNLNCHYCHSSLKDGTNPFPAIEPLSLAFAQILEQGKAFSIVKLELAGGEPTQSAALIEMIQLHSTANILFKLYSNAQAEVSWWAAIAKNLYDVTLTYHASTNLNHFINVLNVVKDTANICVYVAHTPNEWNQCYAAYLQIKQIISNTSMQLLYSNFTTGNNQYLAYSKEQWDTYYLANNIDPNNTAQVSSTAEFKRINLINNFYGHLCYAGVNQIIIDNFGYVWRGWCKSNNHMGNIFNNTFVLDATPKPCPKIQCTNGFDLIAHKSNKSWGIV